MMKTHRKGILFLAVFFALAMILAGCGGGGGNGDGGSNIPPTITLLVPDGGEVLKGGANVNITWTASDDATLPASCIKLEYTDGGSYTVIASSLANSGLYSWTVPTIDSLVVQVRASVTDSNNNTVQDSSGTFTIDSTPPTVNVTAPASDSTVNANDTVPITWSASDNVALAAYPITIEYSDNDGADAWTMIIANTLNDGTHDWVLPGGLVNAHIRVSAVDSAGNTSFDVANGRITSNTDSIAPTVTGISYGVEGSTADLISLNTASGVRRAEYLPLSSVNQWTGQQLKQL